MGIQQFRLPDVGEGLVEAEIVSWKVKAGDTVKLNDTIVEIETAKSLVELPVPFAGVVTELLVPEGETVPVGTPIISVQTGEAAPGDLAPPVGEGTVNEDMIPVIPDSDGEEIEAGKIGGAAPGGRTAVLVGYGPKTTEAKRRPRKGAGTPAPAEAAPAQSPPAQPAEGAPANAPGATGAAPAHAPAAAGAAQFAREALVAEGNEAGGSVHVLAKPPVRKLAKDLGIDLASVTATGPGGIITRADVEGHAAGAAGSAPAAAPAAVAAPVAAPVAGQLETRIPVKGVQKVMAQAMVNSAFTAPHVTEWITVDVSATMELVERLKSDKAFRDLRVSPLLIVAKAVTLAARRTPIINAAWDEAAQEIVLKHSVNLGIAAATPRGLIVPNIKGADAMTLPELCAALNDLVAVAREGKTQPADQAGGSFTITNVGVFGVDAGTPIINPGEAAILAFGAVRKQPWVVDDEIVPRWITTLALSFDHRLIDGEKGSTFLADVAAILEDPARALMF
ncbi:pyruvate dehydrogenase E2 component (dihydrolipoamide acetyltransferase) [Kribbella orskensis]|uniref:Dihydrolipoamide acetyltransferase component of pyruvate dehydrogenase complex n=1 Tax=Kribbella orskensis TaxID=2512216 RepID=A0ABY2BQK3_9ACTN|nr:MULTISPECIES: dihydrolipoamide acetyltransferase family protein [Kribbella]TCN37184.1 pyruvate dehydrogenase E2 component (dihydrolipoamide acetyltransferase) [Kribbella sp. VKM Ac-2500]TCO27908.1 pyruvate dehydrogenase E2 component (dihydrolipoamide acetyltransferase) [Kribbella orskensis]